MLNLKKIVIGMGLLGALATAGFGEEVKLDNAFCKAYNYSTYNYLVNEDYSTATNPITIAAERNSSKSAGDMRFSAMYGALSTDFLKEAGIGYSINMNWGNIVVAFNEYMKYAHSDEDKKDLRKFSLIFNYLKEWKPQYIDTNKFSFRDCIYLHTNSLYSERAQGKIDDNIGAIKLTDEFASANGSEKKLLSPFVKYIVNKDYVKAKEYIKSTNKKYGINTVYSEFENACEK